MSSIINPTLVLAAGAFGRAVAARLQEDAAALPEADRTRLACLPADALDALPGLIESALAALLRTGSGRPQLDALIVADTREVDAAGLVGIAHAFSEVLARSFAVLFPPSLEANQRQVWLNVVLATPALTGTGGESALQATAQLERWHLEGHAPSPCLSRVWLAPRQTAAGVLTDEDVLRSVHLFASAAYLSGQRQSDVMRSRLEPARDPTRLVGTFSVAAADVPVARVIDYCAWRTALLGLDRLSSQAREQAPDEVSADALAPGLAVSARLDEFDSDEVARRLLGRSQRSAPARRAPLPSWTNPKAGTELLSEWRGSTPAATTQAPDESDPLFTALDAAEARLIGEAASALRAAVEDRLRSADGLRSLTAIERALDAELERLDAASTVRTAAHVEASGTSEAPGLTGLESAARARPSLMTLLPAAALIAVVASLSVAGLLVADTASAAAPATGVKLTGVGGAGLQGASLASTLVPALLVGAGAAAAWVAGVLAWTTRKLREAMQQHAAGAVADSRGDEAAMTLAARRARLARSLAAVVRAKRERLSALRTALEEARKRASDELTRLRVRPGATLAEDRADGLLDEETPLHRSLWPAESLPALCARTRDTRDESTWAARLLEAAWPESGLGDDLPLAHSEPWANAARAQHSSLAEQSPFSWPGASEHVSERLTTFVRESPAALGFGVRAVREDGTPAGLVGEGDLLLLAHGDVRPALEQAARGGQLPALAFLWASTPAPRVVLFTTGTGLDAASLWRGLGR